MLNVSSDTINIQRVDDCFHLRTAQMPGCSVRSVGPGHFPHECSVGLVVRLADTFKEFLDFEKDLGPPDVLSDAAKGDVGAYYYQ